MLDEIEIDNDDRAAHGFVSLDLRNGDFARGAYDDDAANLRRLPVHAQLGLTVEVARRGDRRAWISARSSNGFHSPNEMERRDPRPWYETNNLVAIVVEPAPDLRAGFAYTSKSSPNGVSSATQEASVTIAYAGDMLVALHPKGVVTRRTRGNGGVFTLVGVEPTILKSAGPSGASITLPAAVGVGWRGFYEKGSGDRVFGQVGLSLSVPVGLSGVKSRFKVDATALIRDDRLRRLSGPLGETGVVVPIVTASFIVAY